MSELQTRFIDDTYVEYYNTGKHELAQIYLKSEADKVIEDIIEGAVSMFRESNSCRGLDTKSPLGRIANVAFKHRNDVEYTKSNNRQLRLDKANLLRSNEHLRSELKTQITARQNDKLEYDLNIRRHKYKRCLDNAWGCQQRMELFHELVLEEARTIALPNEEALQEYRSKRERAAKWRKRWLKLAKKFKEAK